MEENKDIQQEPLQQPAEQPAPAPEQPSLPPAASADEDDVATAEEMEAFIKSRREKKAEEKSRHEDKVDVFGEYQAPENSIDPYLEPDPEVPWVKYEEPLFLSRGCGRCPESYKPVNEMETRRCSKVTSCNWMKGIHQPSSAPFDCVEVRFKNNRKDFYRLPDGLEVTEGDVVAVEGQPGHDVGIVSLTGEVCRIQMKKRKVDPSSETVKRLFRRAKVNDIESWARSLQDEKEALFTTRKIAQDLGLEMKVNDVEYQGDHSKAIFYYTADDRVDFRSLIKLLADEFHVRIEMKQIGVRQEASKVGGIGTCGRELCCSTWLTNFKSVTTAAAKTQQILPNPQKLAGQCGKLKCCLNFECEVYADALKKFPQANTPIRFKKGLALYKKTDVLRGIMWYAYEGQNELVAITAEDVKKVMEMNRNQEYPESLEEFQVELMSTSGLAQEASTAEFESELRRMADDQGETKRDDRRDRGDRGEHRSRRDDRHRDDRHRDDRHRDDRHRNDRRRDDKAPRDEQPRPEQPRDEHPHGSDEQRPRNDRHRSRHRNDRHPKPQNDNHPKPQNDSHETK